MSFMYSYWLHQLIEIELLWGWSTRCWWSCTSELSYNSYYFISWWDHLLTTLRICVDSITCLDYSILDRRLLLTVDILFTCETWLIILNIYLTTIMFMLLKFAGKILLHGNNTRMFTCYIFLLYRYPVPWYFILLLYRYPDFHMLILLPW